VEFVAPVIRLRPTRSTLLDAEANHAADGRFSGHGDRHLLGVQFRPPAQVASVAYYPNVRLTTTITQPLPAVGMRSWCAPFGGLADRHPGEIRDDLSVPYAPLPPRNASYFAWFYLDLLGFICR